MINNIDKTALNTIVKTKIFPFNLLNNFPVYGFKCITSSKSGLSVAKATAAKESIIKLIQNKRENIKKV